MPAATRAVLFPHGELVGRAGAENAEILGQDDELRALRRGGGNQRFRLRKIGGDVTARNRLHCGDA